MLKAKGGNCSAHAFAINISVSNTGQKEKRGSAHRQHSVLKLIEMMEGKYHIF